MDSDISFDENAYIESLKNNYVNQEFSKEVIRTTSFMKKHKLKKSDVYENKKIIKREINNFKF